MKLQLFLLMLVILNPFAQVLYLNELMNRLKPSEFLSVHLNATLLSLSIFILFAIAGKSLLEHVFQVRLASLQIFGGLIMLYLAYRYVTQGPGSNLMFQGSISELAPQVSLPYMVGPGTLWTSILIGERLFDETLISVAWIVGIIAGVLTVNFLAMAGARWLVVHVNSRSETMLAKYFAILMRTNALFIGAVAVEMIVSGLQTQFQDPNLLP